MECKYRTHLSTRGDKILRFGFAAEFIGAKFTSLVGVVFGSFTSEVVAEALLLVDLLTAVDFSFLFIVDEVVEDKEM